MRSSDQYICAFRGRRDNYQVPLALQEANRLEQLITDAYAPAWVSKLVNFKSSRITEKIGFRREARLDDHKVRSLWRTAAIERVRNLSGFSRVKTYELLDRQYSLAAIARARKTRANLFLYSPHAWDAFSASYAHNPRRILFQYHPHVDTEVAVLNDDSNRFPEFHIAVGGYGTINAGIKSFARSRSDDSWKLADHVVCASQFTKETLSKAGADSERLSVIPYGVTLPETPHPISRDKTFHALFVGSGIQRKGLHHLLLAWQRARLPADSKLTLVCRVLEPAFTPIIENARGVRLIREVSRAELAELYSRATLFAMPSLIEGFGQVYLEALSYGLPILGTRHTCTPDLGKEDDGIYCQEVGDLDALSNLLERLSRSLPGRQDINERARQCAARFSWDRFRAGIRVLL
jgi:glycosyltransferase involved in cell wall biosynthesis